MDLSRAFKTQRMAEMYALELSDMYRDYFFYVYRRNDGKFLVDPVGLAYSDEEHLATYHRTKKIDKQPKEPNSLYEI